MIISLTKLGIQQFGKSIQVWIQVGERRYDIEVRIQACSIAGPQIELQGESSVYLSGGFQGFPYQQPGYSSQQPYQIDGHYFVNWVLFTFLHELLQLSIH